MGVCAGCGCGVVSDYADRGFYPAMIGVGHMIKLFLIGLVVLFSGCAALDQAINQKSADGLSWEWSQDEPTNGGDS